ncbi:MAG TPA: hypothetical protein VIK78_16505 [Ruminiclostridium sp.]
MKLKGREQSTFEELAADVGILAVQNKSSVYDALAKGVCIHCRRYGCLCTIGARCLSHSFFICKFVWEGAEAYESVVVVNMAVDVIIKKIGPTATVNTEEIKISHCEILRMEEIV